VVLGAAVIKRIGSDSGNGRHPRSGGTVYHTGIQWGRVIV